MEKRIDLLEIILNLPQDQIDKLFTLVFQEENS